MSSLAPRPSNRFPFALLSTLVLLSSAEALACREWLARLAFWRKPAVVVAAPEPLVRLSQYEPPLDERALSMAFGRARAPTLLRALGRAEMEKPDFKPTGKAYGPDALLDLSKLDKRRTHLWIISEKGELLVGENKNIEGPNMASLVQLDFLGHPGLQPLGATGRMAGELHWVESDKPGVGRWVINDESGRYNVRQLDGKWTPYPDRGETQLKNSQQMFLRAGANVIIAGDQR